MVSMSMSDSTKNSLATVIVVNVLMFTPSGLGALFGLWSLIGALIFGLTAGLLANFFGVLMSAPERNESGDSNSPTPEFFMLAIFCDMGFLAFVYSHAGR